MSKPFRIVPVFGTRPEIIKLFPVVRALEARPEVRCLPLATGQHRALQAQAAAALGMALERDLAVMEEAQTLQGLTARLATALAPALEALRPDLVLVQGDTTTAFMAALSAFYLKIPVGHVEAGLRTRDKALPFPEEINRRLVGALADLHFAPTEAARLNLLAESIPPARVFVTGNTVVDSLRLTLRDIGEGRLRVSPEAVELVAKVSGRRLVLVTGHRRESFGEGLRNICRALRGVAAAAPDAAIVYAVHPNPNVDGPVRRLLGRRANIHLIRPLDYVSFVLLLDRAFLVLTDSGGIQEEATALGRPTLVLRDVTERPEAVESGVARLVGTREGAIREEALRILSDPAEHAAMARPNAVFGDGKASERIADACLSFLKRESAR